MNQININGKQYNIPNGNISIKNNKLYVNGKLVTEDNNIYKATEIVIKGDVENIETDKSVKCNNVKNSIKAGGSVNCDDVGGDIYAGGSVRCDNVVGNVSASGSIHCDSVGGIV